MMKNRLTLGLCMLLLLCKIAFAVTNETATISRFVGESPNEILRQMQRDRISINDATYYSMDVQLSGNRKDDILDVQFGENHVETNLEGWDIPGSRFNYQELLDSINNFESNELFVLEIDGGINHNLDNNLYAQIYDYNYSPNRIIDWQSSFETNNPLVLYDAPYAGAYIPKQDSFVSRLARDSTMITPISFNSPQFANSFLCNLEDDKYLGEIYRDARNFHYGGGSSSNGDNLVGLVLQSYSLYGNPRQRVNMNAYDKNEIREWCFNFLENLAVGIEYLGEVDGRQKFRKHIRFTIPEYNVVNVDDTYYLINSSSTYQDQVFGDLVLPMAVRTTHFPKNTLITNFSLNQVGSPVELNIDSLPSWEDGYVEKNCYIDNYSYQVTFSNSYDENNQDFIAEIHPVEVLNCTQGNFRLYRDFNYSIDFITSAPAMITNIHYPYVVYPHELIQTNIDLMTLSANEEQYTLTIYDDNNNIIWEKDINTSITNETAIFYAPESEGTHTFSAEIIQDNQTYYYYPFEIVVSSLEISADIPKTVQQTQDLTITFTSFNPTNFGLNAKYYLFHHNNIISEGEFTQEISQGINTHQIQLSNLQRQDQNYLLTLETEYLDASKSQSFLLTTNNAPLFFADINDVYEGEQSILELTYDDPDNDNLVLTINDSRFLQGPNNFYWQTSHADSGNYSINISITDGLLSREDIIIFRVKEKKIPATVYGQVNHYNGLSGQGLLTAYIDNMYIAQVEANSTFLINITGDDPETAYKDGAVDGDVISFMLDDISLTGNFEWHEGINETVYLMIPNIAPEIFSEEEYIFYVNQENNFQLTTLDRNLDEITLNSNIELMTPDATFDSQLGIYEWNPEEDDIGAYEITFTASDIQLTTSKNVRIIVLPSQGNINLLSGLLHYWAFEGNSPWPDEIQNFDIQGGYISGPSVFGDSAQSSSYGNYTGTPYLMPTNITISFWMRNSNPSSVSDIFRMGDGTNQNYISLLSGHSTGTDGLHVMVGDNGQIKTIREAGNTPENQWIHWIVTIDGSSNNYKMWRDTNNVQTIEDNTPWDGGYQVSNVEPGTGYSGSHRLSSEYGIDEFAIWGRILSPDELNILINQTPIITNYSEYQSAQAPLILKYVRDVTVAELDTITIDLDAYINTDEEIVFATDASSILPSDSSFNTQTGEFEWTPQIGNAGVYNVSFAVIRGMEFDTQSATITVTQANSAPVIYSFAVGDTIEGLPAAIIALAYDADGDMINYSINDSRFNTTSNVFVWNTDFDSAGRYAFTISAADDYRSTNISVNLSINNTNRPPIIYNITDIIIQETQTATITASGTDPDNQNTQANDDNTITYSVNDTRFSQQNSTTFTWTTGYNNAGIHSIRANMTDGEYTVATTLQITINNVNRPPTITGIIAQNATEPNTVTITPQAQDPDNETIIYTINDTRFNQQNSTFSWTTNYSSAGEYTARITASDGKENTTQITTFKVTNTNRAPELINTGNRTISENEVVEIQLLALDPDNDSITYSTNAENILPSGFLFNNQSGFFFWASNFESSGTYIINFSVTDGTLSDTESVMITVTNTNRPPTLTNIGHIGLLENETVTLIVNATDPDDDILTYSINDTRFSQDNNIFTWYADYDSEGVYTFMITASDGELTDETMLTITVIPVNRAPEILELEDISTDEGEQLLITVNAFDIDGDVLDYMTNANLILHSEHTFNSTTGQLVWTPTFNDSGEYNITMIISDGEFEDSDDMIISVNNINQAPTIDIIEDQMINEGDELIIIPSAYDDDMDELEFEVNDSRFVENEGTFTWETGFDDEGDCNFEVTVSDGELSDSTIFSVQVTDVNRPPVLDFLNDITQAEGTLVQVQATADDPDGDEVTITFEEPLNSSGEWMTDFDDAGEYTTTVTASDGELTDTVQVQITITDTIITCIDDDDCGESGYVGEPFCSENNLFDSFVNYECENPGTPESYCTNSSEEQMTQDCDEVCIDDNCVPWYDIAVENMTASTDEVGTDETVTVVFYLKNHGLHQMNNIYYLLITGEDNVTNGIPINLQINRSLLVSNMFEYSNPGIYQLTVIADSHDNFLETDEENNIASHIIIVGNPLHEEEENNENIGIHEQVTNKTNTTTNPGNIRPDENPIQKPEVKPKEIIIQEQKISKPSSEEIIDEPSRIIIIKKDIAETKKSSEFNTISRILKNQTNLTFRGRI